MKSTMTSCDVARAAVWVLDGALRVDDIDFACRVVVDDDDVVVPSDALGSSYKQQHCWSTKPTKTFADVAGAGAGVEVD
jgi:hypothetical protein